MRYIFGLACIMVLGWASAGHAACCREVPNWYAGLGGSLVFIEDSELNYSYSPSNLNGNIGRLSFDPPGFGYFGNVGYRVLPFLRTEFEAAYFRSEDVDAVGFNAQPISEGQRNAGQRALTLMANAYLDWRNSSYFTPYVGAGAGMMYLRSPLLMEFRDNSNNVTESKSLKDWVFAYQFMAGVSHELHGGAFSASPIEITLGYRYLTGEDGETSFSSFPGLSTSFGHTSHHVDLGLRVYF